MKPLKLSLIIPTYNEAKIIREKILEVLKFLELKDYGWELIIVDDGSRDQTVEIVKSLKQPKIKIVRLAANSGKGAAIRAGVGEASGEAIVFSDADLSVPISFIDVFLARLAAGVDLVIGSRRVRAAHIIKHQNLIRELLGRVFTLLSKLITLTNTSDFTCGFKAFRRSAAKNIFAKTILNRWVYDTEIIFLARKFKYRITEVPVDWINREDSRVSLGNAVLTSLVDLFKIRIYDLFGKYD